MPPLLPPPPDDKILPPLLADASPKSDDDPVVAVAQLAATTMAVATKSDQIRPFLVLSGEIKEDGTMMASRGWMLASNATRRVTTPSSEHGDDHIFVNTMADARRFGQCSNADRPRARVAGFHLRHNDACRTLHSSASGIGAISLSCD
jgi:hypothetical protein